MFVIIANEDFEDYWGGITRKGDVLETTMHENENEFLKYLLDKYGPTGENIKVKWKKLKVKK